jgi:hypothetical protein
MRGTQRSRPVAGRLRMGWPMQSGQAPTVSLTRRSRNHSDARAACHRTRGPSTLAAARPLARQRSRGMNGPRRKAVRDGGHHPFSGGLLAPMVSGGVGLAAFLLWHNVRRCACAANGRAGGPGRGHPGDARRPDQNSATLAEETVMIWRLPEKPAVAALIPRQLTTRALRRAARSGLRTARRPESSGLGIPRRTT